MRRPLVAAVDLLACLLLVFVVKSLVENQQRNIQTPGQYAVTLQWPSGNPDDLDLYLRDPAGGICYFGATQTDAMQLEHDDLGILISGVFQRERIVVRSVTPGEFVTNVHYYRSDDNKPVRATVQVWNLRGDDKLVASRTVTLRYQGDEVTGFRFTVNRQGEITKINHLPVKFVHDAKSSR